MKRASNWGSRLKKKSSSKKRKLVRKSGWESKKTKPKRETKPLPGNAPVSYDVQEIKIADIEVGNNRRDLDNDKVKQLAESISVLGFREPIMVRAGKRDLGWGKSELRYILVDGLHRLEAMKQADKTVIPAFVMTADKRVARMWEISANLHRAELTPLQRADQTAEWLRLYREQQNAGQNVRDLHRDRRKGGIAEAARKLPVKGKNPEAKRKAVERDLKVAAISAEAKVAAQKEGIDKNQSLMLKIAAKKTPAAQLAKVHELAAQKAGKAKSPEGAKTIVLSDKDKDDLEDLIEQWNKSDLKDSFLEASDKVQSISSRILARTARTVTMTSRNSQVVAA
jgi:ParB/RepB/Spo0J family partition protein